MPMPAARLEVQRLSAGYGPTQILSEMSFDVPAVGRLEILGRNGVGKTTLLATLMGLTTKHHGHILTDGRDISGLRTSARALCGMGYVPQTRDIFRSLTVEENLSTGLKARERAALAEMYEMFPRLAERRRHFGLQLSGGEQQMLARARVMLGMPKLVLIDEPSEGLAPMIVEEIFQMIRDIRDEGAGILLVEQNVHQALMVVDRFCVVERGRIIERGDGKSEADRERLFAAIAV
jgi:branched-chain amino acid transport system ATP-binding protein